jgi:hypothetical protein
MKRFALWLVAVVFLLLICVGFLVLSGLVLVWVDNPTAEGAQLSVGISGHEIETKVLSPSGFVTFIFVPRYEGDVEITCRSAQTRRSYDLGYITSATFLIQRLAIHPCSRLDLRKDYLYGSRNKGPLPIEAR